MNNNTYRGTVFPSSGLGGSSPATPSVAGGYVSCLDSKYHTKDGVYNLPPNSRRSCSGGSCGSSLKIGGGCGSRSRCESNGMFGNCKVVSTNTTTNTTNTTNNDQIKQGFQDIVDYKWDDISDLISDYNASVDRCQDASDNLYRDYITSSQNAWSDSSKERFDELFKRYNNDNSLLNNQLKQLGREMDEVNETMLKKYNDTVNKVMGMFN